MQPANSLPIRSKLVFGFVATKRLALRGKNEKRIVVLQRVLLF